MAASTVTDTVDFYDLFRGRNGSSAAPAGAVVTPIRRREPAEGLHPYAAAIRDAWLDRLDQLPRPWVKGASWDTNSFVTARKLIELANSPWSGYDLATARADYLAHAPHDHVWDGCEKCWDQAAKATGAAGLPEPEPGEQYEPPPVTVLPDLDPAAEDAFWGARPLLRHLHDFARARRASPWAVLGVTLARILTATPAQVCLPPIVGGRGSLNTFVGLVGPSGAGKGVATAAATDAVHISGIKTARLASGEAIAHLYKRRLTKGEKDAGESDWTDATHARLVDVSEIDRFAAQSGRQGSTLMADLRAAWSGEMLGQVAADPSRSFLVEAHEYRLCLVAGVQPHRAGVLLDDADGGTPQRFLWLPVTDPDAPDERPEEPAPIAWSPPRLGSLVGVGGARMDLDPAIVAEVDAARLATLRGEGDPLDGHVYQCRLKVAAALALADDRLVVTTEDWDLSEVIMRKSAATRAAVIEAMERRTVEEGRRRAEADAARAITVEERTIDAAVRRVCVVITKKLRRTGDWVPHADLRRAVAGRDRAHFEDALRRLYEAGQIEHDGNVVHGGNGAYRLAGEDR
ncbi:hypothetical protein MF406_14295 [Georgenia sp. TF02-10]|uniref:hypothetical protein n=1 Tax=Georgenia sp. TF02-10 TaxID=2917725 RepID=UPI001FA6F894|nr:hypothetical protein [Georgenia sp. TF02-10]UNX54102.1 hypothetical protein MF406_14295 [Georgenia sp. TF02-10]